YRTAYQLSENLPDDERVDARQARRTLARWTSLHPTNVAQKVEFVVNHFQKNVAHLLNGHSKAMVVTSSRDAAVKYRGELDQYVQGQSIEVVNAREAFSGEILGREVSDEVFDFAPERKFNEHTRSPDLLGRDLPTAFDASDYQVMIVANKFQTGFDQKKLVAMYLDKRVSGVEAVQTLSRLNRTYPGKDTTYVIDFANDADTIVEAFRTFYRHA